MTPIVLPTGKSIDKPSRSSSGVEKDVTCAVSTAHILPFTTENDGTKNITPSLTPSHISSTIPIKFTSRVPLITYENSSGPNSAYSSEIEDEGDGQVLHDFSDLDDLAPEPDHVDSYLENIDGRDNLAFVSPRSELSLRFKDRIKATKDSLFGSSSSFRPEGHNNRKKRHRWRPNDYVFLLVPIGLPLHLRTPEGPYWIESSTTDGTYSLCDEEGRGVKDGQRFMDEDLVRSPAGKKLNSTVTVRIDPGESVHVDLTGNPTTMATADDEGGAEQRDQMWDFYHPLI